MSLIDVVMLGIVAVFALVGWHRGFIGGLLSFAGFLGGALVAAFALPPLVGGLVSNEFFRAMAVGIGILVCALLGQLLASVLGDRVRAGISWRPARLVDNAGGALLNVLALAVVCWIVANVVAFLPASPASQQVAQSRVLATLDSIVPDAARDAFGELRDLVATSEVPRILSGFGLSTGPEVAAPDRLAVTAAVRRAGGSIVQVIGAAERCNSDVSGSGFVIAPERVMTNAHVVAGVTEPRVRMSPDGPGVPAVVVYFDPRTDVAVLRVPGLDAPPLDLGAAELGTGDGAVVAGYPLGGPYRVQPARVRTVIDARGEDIYGASGVSREVYAFRGKVRPGNSGGPLLAPSGDVVGLVFGTDVREGGTGYALTIDSLQGAITDGLAGRSRVDSGTCNVRD